MIYDVFPSPSKHIKNFESNLYNWMLRWILALGVSLFPPPQDSQDGSPAEAADAEGAAASETAAPAKAAPKGSPAAAPTTAAVARDYTRDMAQLGWWRSAQPLRFLTCFFNIDFGVFWSCFMFFFHSCFFPTAWARWRLPKVWVLHVMCGRASVKTCGWMVCPTCISLPSVLHEAMGMHWHGNWTWLPIPGVAKQMDEQFEKLDPAAGPSFMPF